MPLYNPGRKPTNINDSSNRKKKMEKKGEMIGILSFYTRMRGGTPKRLRWPGGWSTKKKKRKYKKCD